MAGSLAITKKAATQSLEGRVGGGFPIFFPRNRFLGQGTSEGIVEKSFWKSLEKNGRISRSGDNFPCDLSIPIQL
jgi:hypothetical protein